MITKQDLVQSEKYLKLNESGEFVLDYDGELEIIDFHTHMCNILPMKHINPNLKGNNLKYPTVPSAENIDFSVPYWTKVDSDINRKGFMPVIRYSLNAYGILQDMMKGGTYENCFKSQGRIR